MSFKNHTTSNSRWMKLRDLYIHIPVSSQALSGFIFFLPSPHRAVCTFHSVLQRISVRHWTIALLDLSRRCSCNGWWLDWNTQNNLRYLKNDANVTLQPNDPKTVCLCKNIMRCYSSSTSYVCVGLCALRLVVVLLSFRSLAACSRKLNAYVSVLCQDDNMREKNVECWAHFMPPV